MGAEEFNKLNFKNALQSICIKVGQMEDRISNLAVENWNNLIRGKQRKNKKRVKKA